MLQIPTITQRSKENNNTIMLWSNQSRLTSGSLETGLLNQRMWKRVKMRLNYTLLLKDISKKQGLGIPGNELPLIINTDLTIYTMCFITYEDDDYLVIVIPDEKGQEYAKILNKDTILSVEVLYAQMLQKPKSPKGDVMYG